MLTIDRTTRDGRRDYALLATMFNTGARVQEILDLRPSDVQLVSPAHVRLFGKGRKERLCPLWPQTAQLLRAYISERGLTPASTQPLFVNHRGAPLTRFGVRYLLAKYCDRARTTCPSLAGQAAPPAQPAAQRGRPSPEGGRRSRDHQSLAGSRQPEYHPPLRGHRFGDQASRAHESPTDRQQRRRRRVAIGRDHSRMARSAVTVTSNVESGSGSLLRFTPVVAASLHITAGVD